MLLLQFKLTLTILVFSNFLTSLAGWCNAIYFRLQQRYSARTSPSSSPGRGKRSDGSNLLQVFVCLQVFANFPSHSLQAAAVVDNHVLDNVENNNEADEAVRTCSTV